MIHAIGMGPASALSRKSGPLSLEPHVANSSESVKIDAKL